MIDIENQIVTKMINALGETADVRSDLTQTPGRFPCVYVVEADNYNYRRTMTSSSNENHVNVMYEVHCYSNAATGKRSECKSVFALADAVMQRLGFTRISKTNITQNDATIYRIVGRYTAVVSKNETIFRG